MGSSGSPPSPHSRRTLVECTPWESSESLAPGAVLGREACQSPRLKEAVTSSVPRARPAPRCPCTPRHHRQWWRPGPACSHTEGRIHSQRQQGPHVPITPSAPCPQGSGPSPRPVGRGGTEWSLTPGPAQARPLLSVPGSLTSSSGGCPCVSEPNGSSACHLGLDGRGPWGTTPRHVPGMSMAFSVVCHRDWPREAQLGRPLWGCLWVRLAFEREDSVKQAALPMWGPRPVPRGGGSRTPRLRPGAGPSPLVCSPQSGTNLRAPDSGDSDWSHAKSPFCWGSGMQTVPWDLPGPQVT